ncbi:hypothetical protein SAMN04489761_1187 [Tenacibaculum sp. MAR_2009_124]|uniref:hypothetical protein n=1 Tax=Tenacibaculum sp. MAR_2009_124 TaxID=1250059 RepID=UPI000898C0E9|nr:hypothetical protein [Tenacibaculum sp. MAR_2009_124]SEB52061.1 hypothetical protein SAMN04489761_1187 [Tenacibaculum sp. MAR_2009_124]
MNDLQKALKINALFSSMSGLILILLSHRISKIFGFIDHTAFWIIGIVLIYFALTIWYEIKKQRRLAVVWIIIQDFVWVLASIVLIILNPFAITKIGITSIVIIALIVLYMGINQIIGLNKTTVKT